MTRLSLCHQSSFCAENVLVTIVPSFSSPRKFPVIGATQKVHVGPFVGGMPMTVPLWVAKTLKRRNFADIELPDWLSVPVLSSILREERESTLLSRRLPFYYYEIARALDGCLTDATTTNTHPSSSSSDGGGTTVVGGGGGKAVKVVLHDLIAVRSDKLRHHFHELSKSDLVHPPPGYDDDLEAEGKGRRSPPPEGSGGSGDLPIISVTGICSYELNKVGPFLQRAFSDYGFLTRRSSVTATATTTGASSTTSTSKTAPTPHKYEEHDEELDPEEEEYNTTGGAVENRTTSRKSVGRSRLRRFRS